MVFYLTAKENIGTLLYRRITWFFSNMFTEGTPCCTHKCVTKGEFSEADSQYSDYSDIIMGAMASEITSLTIVYLTVYLGTNQRKHQSSALLAFVWGIRATDAECFHVMTSSWWGCQG